MAPKKASRPPAPKSIVALGDDPALASSDQLGRSYYAFCLEQALMCVHQARLLVKDDPVEENHELPLIEHLLREAWIAT